MVQVNASSGELSLEWTVIVSGWGEEKESSVVTTVDVMDAAKGANPDCGGQSAWRRESTDGVNEQHEACHTKIRIASQLQLHVQCHEITSAQCSYPRILHRPSSPRSFASQSSSAA